MPSLTYAKIFMSIMLMTLDREIDVQEIHTIIDKGLDVAERGQVIPLEFNIGKDDQALLDMLNDFVESMRQAASDDGKLTRDEIHVAIDNLAAKYEARTGKALAIKF